MVAEADHLNPRLIAVGQLAQCREHLLFGSRGGQPQAIGAADLPGHRAVDQLIGGGESESIEHAPLAHSVRADVSVAKRVVVVDNCGALGHEATPVSGIAVTRCVVK